MLIVRDEQIEVFERRLFETVQQRVHGAIEATFPELSRGAAAERGADTADKLGTIVARGIESAVRFDIGEGPDIAAFIALGLALRVAPPGESGRWIHEYLNRLDTSGPTKLRMIESRLRALAAQDQTLRPIAERVAQARKRAAA